MSSLSTDQAILAVLATTLPLDRSKMTYNETGNLIELDVSGLGLLEIPHEIRQLTNLRTLDLGAMS